MSKVKTKKKIKVLMDMKSFEYSQALKLADSFATYMMYAEGLANINGAYSEVEYYDCDDKYAYIEAITGEQDMGSGSGCLYKSSYKIKRNILRSKKTIQDKIKAIVDADYEEDDDE